MTYTSLHFARKSCVLLALAGLAACAQHQTPPAPPSPEQPRPGALHLSADQIPAPPGSLPVLRLAAQKPPADFVRAALHRSAPRATALGPLASRPQLGGPGSVPKEILGAFEADHLAAYVNLESGDAEIFPALARQKAVAPGQEAAQLERAARVARDVWAKAGMLQPDATRLTLEPPRPLYGEIAEHKPGTEGRAGSRGLYLTYVAARRSVDGHFVYGPGSRALVAVGTDGSVQGFARHWKAATASGEVRETRTREQVADAIRAELSSVATSADVTVMTVEIAYYDANRDYLQPVYRFTARTHEQAPPGAKAAPRHRVNDDFIVGYIPIGQTLERVPSRAQALAANPGTPPGAPAATAPKQGDPTVGRYVVRNDDSNWVADANEFWGGLSSFFGTSLFTDSQYYWAYPFEFDSSEASYVDSVQIGLTEAHGDWWYFTTYQNWGDAVDITAIPAARGYGAASGGSLDYWILHSCEVVPSAIDAPCPSDNRPWWTPWFNVFQGLHTVVGYRTIMWIDDDVGGPFGLAMRFGAPVVSAWFNATTSAPGYMGNPTYPAHCGTSPPMGRPSTVSVCGRQDDWVYDTAALQPADCLINFWQPD